jgi:SM-20-related protein
LHKQFDGLIDSFIEEKVGIQLQFLSEELANNLRNNLLKLYSNNELHQARIGNQEKLTKITEFRSDKIYWLDKSHHNIYENQFLELMDEFILYLNRTCYTGITSCEFHYAMYEEGSFYKRHLDQFKSDQSREFSMIIYLNDTWQEGDGGELCIYHKDTIQIITPTNRKAVFFKSSELEHEVLLSHKKRLSITGWFKKG